MSKNWSKLDRADYNWRPIKQYFARQQTRLMIAMAEAGLVKLREPWEWLQSGPRPGDAGIRFGSVHTIHRYCECGPFSFKLDDLQEVVNWSAVDTQPFHADRRSPPNPPESYIEWTIFGVPHV